MSRGFVKNDRPDEPIVVPPRAPLPLDTINYITPRGLALLRAELAGLEVERFRVQSDNSDQVSCARELAAIGERITNLIERLGNAQLVDPHDQPHDAVRFGATVTLQTLTGSHAGDKRHFTIVGVDEADVAEGRVAFTAPIARAILGRHVGETALLQTAQGDEELEIVAIEYAEA
jgi:transcription elongation factor GreB